MSVDVKELLNKAQLNQNDMLYFEKSSISALRFYKNEALFEIEINIDASLPYEVYTRTLTALRSIFPCEVNLLLVSASTTLSTLDIIQYFNDIALDPKYHFVKDMSFIVKDDLIQGIVSDEQLLKQAKANESDILEILKKYGINYAIAFSLKEVKLLDKEMKLPVSNINDKVEVVENKQYVRTKKLNFDQYKRVSIKDLKEEEQQVSFWGTVFDVNNITTRNGKMIQTIMAHDDESAITIKRFEGRYTSKEDIEAVKKGNSYVFYGNYEYGNFERDYIFKAELMNKFELKDVVFDTSDVKRCELHAHSNMSEMDGVNEVSDLIKRAYKYKHRAIAITDHMVVQAFPSAQQTLSQILKADPDADFKVLYGAELNMVEGRLNIVYNPCDKTLDEVTYCVFDLETTGLSCRYEDIIEFGGVKVKNGQIIDKLQMFIKPSKKISSFITSKTNITNEMVQDALTFEQAKDTILKFMDDCVLVAHNASFDYDFMNAALTKLGLPKLNNPVIDTLDLSRALHKERRTYRLGNIARLYRVVYDEEVAHRADYDAQVLADVFQFLLNDCKQRGAKTIKDLNDLQDSDAFVKNMARHTTVLVKNKAGLKRLFELITISHTKTLAMYGKASSKAAGEEVMAEPRILREELAKNRENILIGTSCSRSEIFEIAANKTQEALEKALEFYDYVEIQPLENYRPLVENHMFEDFTRLKQVLLNLINTAKKLKKLVVVSGDVHYVNKGDKILRDIYINTQAIGGVRHPLYIYDENRRRNTINPDQHLRTTDEMLEAFDWLDQDLAYELIVTNTNKIADMCEQVKPIHKDLYTPRIEGADEKLREICYQNARSIYGDDLPEIVDKRLKRELDSIIGNGFGVIYYISHLLVKKSNDDGYLVGSRGSVGSSFVATMSKITEVNPLAPHYVCPNCHYSEFFTDGSVASGYDLQDKCCPKCQTLMKPDGQDIPFETFLGFEGDKVPDIDLNFSGEYQPIAHAYTKEVFGEEYVYRAGTIGTVAQKTAFGYVAGYCEDKNITNMSNAQKTYLSNSCVGVKRTTGQHPGGIIVIPNYMDVHDFTPVNYPANNPNSDWKTTHFDFHAIHDNVLKFDILGHVDPTVMRFLQNISGIDPKTIPMNDLETMSLFSSSEALKANPAIYNEPTGAVGLPEFGTKFVRGILELTKPKTFSDLVIISGLSHGTDVWLNNAKDLVEQLNIPLQQVIGCRDDIMVYLIHKGLKPKDAFTIMESVRKGKGLKPEWIEIMRANNVDEWYIESCLKIKYMFPKAHAVAYVIMAIRCAWFKVHHPHYYYAAYFSLRCDAFEIETMVKDAQGIIERMQNISSRLANPETKKEVSVKEIDLYSTLENCLEMVARGYRFSNIDLMRSKATEFSVSNDDEHIIIPPFTVIDGLGENVAKSIVEAREQKEFLSKEDLMNRTQLSKTLIRKMEILKILDGLQEENQLSLF